jgi:hypothetical protein
MGWGQNFKKINAIIITGYNSGQELNDPLPTDFAENRYQEKPATMPRLPIKYDWTSISMLLPFMEAVGSCY